MKARMTRPIRRLIEILDPDPATRRRAELLNFVLLVLSAAVVVVWAVDFLGGLLLHRSALHPVFGLGLLVIFGSGLVFNHRVAARWAAYYVLSMLVLVVSLIIPLVPLDLVYELYLIPVILASFVLAPLASFFVTALAVLASSMMILLGHGSLRSLVLPVPVLLTAALMAYVLAARWEARLAEMNQKNNELTLAYDRAVEGWSRAIELADRETPGHTRRVTELALGIGRQAGLNEQELADLRRGALLHDIGKMYVPEQILMKAGALDEQEMAAMKRHPIYAYEMLSDIPFLRPAIEVALYHHEAWDGSGYPSGLEGEHIPRLARIFTVADVWDSLSTDRRYRLGWAKTQIKTYLLSESGRRFDPQVVEALTRLEIWQG
jgi:hypothetical protein